MHRLDDAPTRAARDDEGVVHRCYVMQGFLAVCGAIIPRHRGRLTDELPTTCMMCVVIEMRNL